MKRLDITTPVAQRLAEIALYERIQHKFKLHTSSLVKKLKYDAKHCIDRVNCRPIDLIRETTIRSIVVFEYTLYDTEKLLSGLEPVKRKLSSKEREMIEYFHLDPLQLSREIRSRAEIEDCQPLEVVNYLKIATKHIILSTFREVERVLRAE